MYECLNVAAPIDMVRMSEAEDTRDDQQFTGGEHEYLRFGT